MQNGLLCRKGKWLVGPFWFLVGASGDILPLHGQVKQQASSEQRAASSEQRAPGGTPFDFQLPTYFVFVNQGAPWPWEVQL
jgi:hypothetical protein